MGPARTLLTSATQPTRPSGQRRSGTRPASHAYTRLSRRGSAQVHFDVYRAGDICLTAEGMARFLARQPPVVVEKKAITLDPKVLDRYVGTYVIGAGASLIVTREGAGLVVRQSGS